MHSVACMFTTYNTVRQRKPEQRVLYELSLTSSNSG